ncbi:hypothetical protein SADUNF_Sadunf02G0108800 [Salix dunnii]|uniref:Uncharacterized protein n=1 Tax=Salix dunnii TaxID=1413687 RepID=A0A835TGT2_9ROSI|nr:hypothetical protein SADUNF_Sadunf02G0108800 [Salix dunnii]
MSLPFLPCSLVTTTLDAKLEVEDAEARVLKDGEKNRRWSCKHEEKETEGVVTEYGRSELLLLVLIPEPLSLFLLLTTLMFCVPACIDHRGTPESPPRTCTLENVEGAICSTLQQLLSLLPRFVGGGNQPKMLIFFD